MNICENNIIKVAICCITYNHEAFIRQCIEGFVMQKTNFRFVAIIHDDCSTDRTADIIREYVQKYPDIIIPIYENENQYKKRMLGRIMNDALNTTMAEYIAICEGDDFWIDPYKLQKQVDYLDEHPDYVLCAHNAYQQFANNTRKLFVDPNFRNHDIGISELLSKWNIPTASLIYRKQDHDLVYISDSYPNGDYYLLLRLLSQGKFHYDPSVMSVYRMHGDSVSAEMNRNKVKMYDDIISLLNGVRTLYKEGDQPLFDAAISNYEKKRLDYMRTNDSVKKWFYRKTYTRAVKKTVKKIFKL